MDFLEKAEKWVDEIPLQTSPQRFGNKAFREWIARLEQVRLCSASVRRYTLANGPGTPQEAPALQSALLSSEQQPVLTELSHHFLTSFGSAARLDYGTGHELSFLAYLLILRLIGVLQEQDEQAMVTRVFVAYLCVVRKLQKVFRLEPAGSKGGWGLDDHQHLVYLWGASQLRSESLSSQLLAPRLQKLTHLALHQKLTRPSHPPRSSLPRKSPRTAFRTSSSRPSCTSTRSNPDPSPSTRRCCTTSPPPSLRGPKSRAVC